MLRFKLFPLVGLITLLASSAFGQSTQPAFSSTQSIRITGTVRYADGSPANEVIVRVERLSGGGFMETRTDRLGKFVFTGLSPAQYHLTIRHPGYKDVEREVNLIFTGQENVQLGLFPDPNEVGKKPPPAPIKQVLDASIPVEARKEYEKANALLASDKKEKLSEAAVHLQKALALYPKFLEAQLKLGVVYMDLQQWPDAEAALKQALALNPKTVNAYLALGEVYFHQKKYNEAEQTVSKGLMIEDRSWQGHFTLARVLYAKGDISRAARQVGLTIQLNEAFPDAHLLAANIHLRVNNKEDAREQFEEYLRLAPKGEYATQARQAVDKLKRQ